VVRGERASKLLTYSTLKYAPTGFSDELPYTIAVVEFQGFKVFGRIDRSVPVEELEVGAAVKAVVVKTPNDRFTYAFKKA
jgi:uncharacterized OB-fold protein